MSGPPYGQDPYAQGPDNPQYPPPGGQQPPPYGNQPPGYGNQPPSYGNQPPGYGNQPSYGNQPPQYGNQPPSYGSQPPGYGNQPPGYGTPPGYPQQGYAGGPAGYGGGQQLAGWGSRVAASLLDALFSLPPIILAVIILAVTSNPDTVTANGTGSGVNGIAVVITVLLYLSSFGLTIYNRFIQQGRTGQSWGKKVMKLRLLGEATGQPIGAGMAFVRDLAHILDGIPCYVGYLWPLWDPKRQTFADKLLSTIVTSEG
jgi:uncharacterized RDD family membrane protein YckC